jgi:excisionase family DNA binding protein
MTVLEEMRQNTLYTAGEAARLLKVSEQTLANWRHTGSVEIPFVRVGRSVKYRHADLMNFIASNTFKNTTEAGFS